MAAPPCKVAACPPRTSVRYGPPAAIAYSENESLAVAKAKESLKQLSPEGRAFVMAWLVKYYRDDGQMFSPSVSTSERRRIAIDGIEYWCDDGAEEVTMPLTPREI